MERWSALEIVETQAEGCDHKEKTSQATKDFYANKRHQRMKSRAARAKAQAAVNVEVLDDNEEVEEPPAETPAGAASTMDLDGGGSPISVFPAIVARDPAPTPLAQWKGRKHNNTTSSSSNVSGLLGTPQDRMAVGQQP